MLHWDDMRIFLALQRHASFARAARHLDVDPTTVGRRIAALEETLGATLFERTPSGLVATSAGAMLRARAERMEAEMLASERELRGQDARLEGPLVITAGDAITVYLLVPWLLELRREHPRITFELRADNAALDMTRREADVAVRLFCPKQTSLVAIRARTFPFAVYGSDAYFARRGKPRNSRQLAEHDWLAWDRRLAATPQSKWLARIVPSAKICLRANTTTALIAACASGHGLAVLPKFVATTETRLLLALARVSPPGREAWIVTHADSRRNARVRAVVAWLAARLKAGA
jgi:DNA-binding transcriptional LysR family regulator